MIFSGFIFDVEGTLIDCGPQTLSSLQDTLPTPYETLQLYSGLDGDETLSIVAPQLDPQEREQLKQSDGKRYEKFYLPNVKPSWLGVLLDPNENAGHAGRISRPD